MQATHSSRPLVGVIACCREVEGHPAQIVTDKFLQALYHYDVTPVILPVLAADMLTPDQRAEQAIALLGSLDGLMLTGSYTNVAPNRYGAERAPENKPYKRYQACSIIVSRPLMTWRVIMHPPIR